jgi:uncharacterized coiled-coil protein SlyX
VGLTVVSGQRLGMHEHEASCEGGGEGGAEAERLQRLEEAQTFQEREAEVLGEQVVRLQQQVQKLAERLVQLEGRLARMMEEEAGE